MNKCGICRDPTNRGKVCGPCIVKEAKRAAAIGREPNCLVQRVLDRPPSIATGAFGGCPPVVGPKDYKERK